MDKKILLAAALACVAGAASAQENIIRPVQGAKEIGIFGNWTSVGGTNSYSINGSVGYYVTNNVVAQVGLGFSKAGGGPTATHIFAGARYEFNVEGQIVPYVLAGISFDDTGSDNTSTFKAGVGANYFIRPNAAFFAELTFFKPSGSDTVTSLDFGLRAFFR
jgi:outer membrane protease